MKRMGTKTISPRRLFINGLVVTTLMMIGVGSVLYPSTAQWWEQKRESAVLAMFNRESEVRGPDSTRLMLEEARQYNEKLYRGGSLDQWEYKTLMNSSPSGIIARVKIDSIGVDQPLRHGMSEAVLAQGLGHLERTSLPIGGVNTHAVIGGHRGLATAVGLTNMNKMQVGDEAVIEIAGQVLVYKAVSKQVLDPGTAEIQPIVPGKDLVTFITCTPLGMNTHRIVVTAERVIPTPQAAVDEAGQTSKLPSFPWWAALFGGAFVLYVGYNVWGWRKLRRIDPKTPRQHARA